MYVYMNSQEPGETGPAPSREWPIANGGTPTPEGAVFIESSSAESVQYLIDTLTDYKRALTDGPSDECKAAAQRFSYESGNER